MWSPLPDLEKMCVTGCARQLLRVWRGAGCHVPVDPPLFDALLCSPPPPPPPQLWRLLCWLPGLPAPAAMGESGPVCTRYDCLRPCTRRARFPPAPRALDHHLSPAHCPLPNPLCAALVGYLVAVKDLNRDDYSDVGIFFLGAYPHRALAAYKATAWALLFMFAASWWVLGCACWTVLGAGALGPGLRGGACI